MEAIISPLSKRKMPSLFYEEVKFLIKEIEKRRHIIFSVSTTKRRLKMKAWEEIASSIALNNPQEPGRSGKQVSYTLMFLTLLTCSTVLLHETSI